MEIKSMKTVLFALCVLCASAAFGQIGQSSLSAQPTVYTFENHPQHASRTPMADPQTLNGNEVSVSAHGERPLWEVAVTKQEVSLGEAARALREEHESAKRAVRSWQN
jgi:hypothetical protein